MRSLAVDFATPRVWTVPLVAWAVVCTVLTCAIFLRAGFLWEQEQSAVGKGQAAQANLLRLEAQARADRRLVPKQSTTGYLRDAQELARVASFPTQEVLRSLEATEVDGIRIQSITLDPQRGSADAAAEFADYAVLLRFIKELNEGESRGRWTLVKAQEVGVKRQAVLRFAPLSREAK